MRDHVLRIHEAAGDGRGAARTSPRLLSRLAPREADVARPPPPASATRASTSARSSQARAASPAVARRGSCRGPPARDASRSRRPPPSPRCTRRALRMLDELHLALVLMRNRNSPDQRQVLRGRAARVCASGKTAPRQTDSRRAEGRRRRCALRWRTTMIAARRARRPASVCHPLPRVARTRLRLCPSSTVSTRQRLSSSSSTSIAVVVRNVITGPVTRYSCVMSFPVSDLSRRRDGDLALTLEKLRRVARALRSFALGDGGPCCREIFLPEGRAPVPSSPVLDALPPG